jgi:tetratricopeptide (TPR) repeat protein
MVKTITLIVTLTALCSFLSCNSKPVTKEVDTKDSVQVEESTTETPQQESSFFTEEQLQEYKTLYDKNPNDYPTANQLARAYSSLKKNSEAEHIYNSFVKNEDVQIALRAKLDRATFFAETGKLDEAYRDFKSITDSELTDLKSEAYFQLGDMLTVKKYNPPDGKKIDLAIQYYSKASELEPSNAVLYRRLADLMHEEGEIDRAREYLAIFLVVYPDDWGSWLDMGDWSVQVKDTKRAREYYERALGSGIPDVEQKASNALKSL